MDKTLLPEIKTFLRQELTQALSFIVGDPRVAWDVVSVTARPTRSVEFDAPLVSVRLKVVTNHRAALLGQPPFLPRKGLAGFAKQYCLGYLDGALTQRFGLEVASTVAITLDVHELPEGQEANGGPAAGVDDAGGTSSGTPSGESAGHTVLYGVYLPLDEALTAGVVHPASPLGQVMEQYGLRYFLLSGGMVGGPCLSMVRAVERVTATGEVHTVLDLFSGTGSLARVALERVERVVCVDTEAGALPETLAGYSDRVTIIEGDARDYVPAERFDLAVLDPFYEEALDVLPPVLRQIGPHCARVLINAGPVEEMYWTSQVTQLARRHARRVTRLPDREHVILLGTF